MDSSDDRVMGGAFLGLVFFGFFVWMLSKVVTRVFHDLGVMFDAIGTATVSFLGMAWALTQLAAILSAGAAVVYAAYRHYCLVRDASSVLANVEARCSNWASNIEASNKELETRLSDEVWHLRRELAAALEKPEAMPEPAKPPAETEAVPKAAEIIAAQMTPTEPTPGVSNPY